MFTRITRLQLAFCVSGGRLIIVYTHTITKTIKIWVSSAVCVRVCPSSWSRIHLACNSLDDCIRHVIWILWKTIANRTLDWRLMVLLQTWHQRKHWNCSVCREYARHLIAKRVSYTTRAKSFWKILSTFYSLYNLSIATFISWYIPVPVVILMFSRVKYKDKVR